MFYTNFVKLCNRKGIAPTAAAAKMGFQRSVATRWSKGAEPRRATLEKVADYFGVSVDYLLNGEKENAPGSDAESEIYKLLAQATPLQLEVINGILDMNENQLNALKKLMDAANALVE